MKYFQASYKDTNSDFYDVHNFLKEITHLTGLPQVWEFVRLEFWLIAETFYSKDPNFLVNNAALWRDQEGVLRGLFISEQGGNYFSVLVHPEHQHLTQDIINYAKNSWGVKKVKLETDGLIHSKEVKTILEMGFQSEGQIGNTREYDLTNREYNIRLEEGFSIKSIKEAPDYLGKWVSIHETYNPNKPIEGDTRYWRKDLPSYSEELDLSVISPDGKHIAFCYGFIDEEHQSAIVETVGTHPDYQKRGFGKAVITECFRRLREKGVKTAYITGFSEAANALYQSLGPREIYPLFKYTYTKAEETNG